jgi:hypothetical protein
MFKSIFFSALVFVGMIALIKTGFTPEPWIDALATWMSHSLGYNVIYLPILALGVLILFLFRAACQ